ncbi:hypothetical protein [Oceanicaulis sp.]|uniref:hypothetical protein n=1 Tax=Oceanicaulis sp. TaxID=1924941 RepID=UPI003F6FDCF6
MSDGRSRGLGAMMAGLSLAMFSVCAAQAQTAQTAQTAQPARLAQPQPVRRTPQPDQPVAAEVDWEAVRADVARSQSAGRLTAARAVSFPVLPRNLEAGQSIETEVPILTPGTTVLGFESQAEVLLFARGDFYTLVIQGEGVIIEVFGTRLAHAQVEDARTARFLRGSGPEGYRTTRTRSGRELTFNRYNVAYSIMIECDAPEQDVRCVEPEYGERLMQSLQVMPGTRGREGAG